ncbi:MAG: hypothetical protein M1840_006228 [Geoglossum simile]|nr:MAG: hypothetical protein M1840_006228 [Geoglossum simile]
MKRLLVVAAANGLVLQPLYQRNLPSPQAVKISYRTSSISSLQDYAFDSSSSSFEAHGVVGLLNVSSAPFLICVSRRQQVAQIRGKPVFVITEVALIPLASQAKAGAAIIEARDAVQRHHQARTIEAGESIEYSDSSAEEDISTVGNCEFSDDDLSFPAPPELLSGATRPGPSQRRTSIAEDVIGRKGLYGRFAEKWFSKREWNAEKMRMQGMSTGENVKPELLPNRDATTLNPIDIGRDEGTDRITQSENMGQNGGRFVEADGVADSAASTLLPKLLRTTKLLLGSSRGFFYSYEHDITRSLKTQDANASGLPLHKVVDPLYFWNRHLTLPFIEAGQHALVLPVMQGFIGQQSFSVASPAAEVEDIWQDRVGAGGFGGPPQDASHDTDDAELLLTLISRRSVKRAGLRYLRRGVDDDGNTANSVETEQILSHPSWDPSKKIYSFVQIRGSVPLYFTQSPFSFKPVPIMQHSPSTNQAAFKKHFVSLASSYGRVQVVSLVEKGGNEAQVGREYEKNIEILNRDGSVMGAKVEFEWFDFHTVCRGMKFEKVGLLIDSLGHILDAFGYTISVDEKIWAKQKGVLRTNCMDCLDRTNVVQSAWGMRALESQLKMEGLDLDDRPTQWFDMLWADNGDAISKQYSSTAALKGDFTRTRKRDYRGALNDFGLTLSRYFNNIIGDYFTQAAIDYLLGNVTSHVFEEFEAEMMTTDPAISMRRVRQDAIETSSKIVIANETEELIDGWTLWAPKEQNATRSFPFEECVLLLTSAALYACRFDWNVEKVSCFERVDLRHVQSLNFGAYITSTLAPAHTDEKRNVGFVVTYKPGRGDVARVNTRSLKSTPLRTGEPANPPTANPAITPETLPTKSPPTRILAFKAIPNTALAPDSHSPQPTIPELDLIRSICDKIHRAAAAGDHIAPTLDNIENKQGGSVMVHEQPIISLDEAKRSTGLLEHIRYSLKKLVWA